MIRHIAELGTLLLLAFVGVGLFTMFIIGLLGIWAKVADEPDAIHEEYKRVEEAGRRLPSEWMGFPVEFDESLPENVIVIKYSLATRPYNWATREPMVWGMHRG
jgi:hypothetical protein